VLVDRRRRHPRQFRRRRSTHAGFHSAALAPACRGRHLRRNRFIVRSATREFGLRMAPGAMPAASAGLTLGPHYSLTLTGGVGLAVSLVLGHLLQSALYPVPISTRVIYGVKHTRVRSASRAPRAIVLALAAMREPRAAGRAARVEPSAALRNE